MQDRNGIADCYQNLGGFERSLGGLTKAKILYQNALDIFIKLQNKEGIASCYGNLGSVAHDEKNFVQAKILWIQSRDLFLAIGLTEKASIFQNGLDHLEKQ